MEFLDQYLRKAWVRSIVVAALQSALDYVQKFEAPIETTPFSEPLTPAP